MTSAQEIWADEEKYLERVDVDSISYPPSFLPLCVWKDMNTVKTTIGGMKVFPETKIWFAFKPQKHHSVKKLEIFRWPLDAIGTEAVKNNSSTERSVVEYGWTKGTVLSLAKGTFSVNPGYLYSIIVYWTGTKEAAGAGWEEYSFFTY